MTWLFAEPASRLLFDREAHIFLNGKRIYAQLITSAFLPDRNGLYVVIEWGVGLIGRGVAERVVVTTCRPATVPPFQHIAIEQWQPERLPIHCEHRLEDGTVVMTDRDGIPVKVTPAEKAAAVR